MTVDRRALSEARYHALHLDTARASCTTIHQTTWASAHARCVHARVSSDRARKMPLPDPPSARCARRPALAAGAQTRVERRTAASRLGRAIVARIVAQPQAAVIGFALSTEHGRLYVQLRRDRGGLRLLALSPASARATVDAALAHVRFALAANGIVLAW